MPLCKQRVETRLGDEVGDNGTRLPAPSLDVRGPLACTNIARAGTVAGPDKAGVNLGASLSLPGLLSSVVDVRGHLTSGLGVSHT